MTADWQRATCPVCGALNRRAPLAEYTVAQAAAHFCHPSRDPVRNKRIQAAVARLWQGERVCFLRCDACGFGYGFPFVAGDEEFYSILHERHGYPQWRWEYDLAIAELKEIAGTEAPVVLDIGSGEGAFLSSLPPLWSRNAIEGSPTTRTLLERQGIVVFPSLERAITARPAAFHLITMIQVLEHLSDFRDVLTNCGKLIRPHGRLIISVPDCDAMIEQERATGCADMPPNHIAKWTPHSLDTALRNAGFEIQRTVIEKPSLDTLKSALHLAIMAAAAKPNSLAWHVYGTKNSWFRTGLLALLTVPVAARVFFHPRYWARGGAFTVIARPIARP